MASEYVFKLKQTFSSSKRGCDCSDSQVNEESICKPQMLLPGAWGAVEDDGGCLFYFNFSQYPHRVQYEPPKLEEDGGGLAWREILSLSEATGLATAMAGGRPLSPMPPLIPPWYPGLHGRHGGGGGGGSGGGDDGGGGGPPGGGGGGGPAVHPGAPPPAPVQGCAGPPVRTADPDLFYIH